MAVASIRRCSRRLHLRPHASAQLESIHIRVELLHISIVVATEDRHVRHGAVRGVAPSYSGVIRTPGRYRPRRRETDPRAALYIEDVHIVEVNHHRALCGRPFPTKEHRAPIVNRDHRCAFATERCRLIPRQAVFAAPVRTYRHTRTDELVERHGCARPPRRAHLRCEHSEEHEAFEEGCSVRAAHHHTALRASARNASVRRARITDISVPLGHRTVTMGPCRLRRSSVHRADFAAHGRVQRCVRLERHARRGAVR